MQQDTLLNSILTSADIIFFSLDLHYCYIDFSTKHYETMKKIWGVEIAKNSNMLNCIQDEKDREKAKYNFDRALNGEKFTLKEDYGDNKLFRTSWEDDYFPIYENGVIIGVGVVVKDLSTEIDKERGEIFQKLINITKSGVVIADAGLEDNPIIFMNDAFETITGYSKDDVIGKNCRFLQGDDKDQPGINIMRKAILNQKSCEVKVKNYKKDGTLFYNLVVITPLFDDNGKLIYYAGFQNDITDLYLIQEKLNEQTYIDELTKAYNRKAFNERLANDIELFHRYNHHFSIAMFDIDNFKHINDTYGHDAGDKVLLELSNHIKSTIRKSDIFYRIGGEEFVILFYETSLENAIMLMEKIRISIQQLRIIKNEMITISVGLTQIDTKDDKNSIFKRADDLMYYSKLHGKNMISTITPHV
ncbi:MAG: hypothetical protein KU38_01745 [Sulfurovum sp. FS08-3]|nr:MAG: hypothetical protein KU38_01745 [Sulfurovum sp. FS08-3]